MSSKIRISLLVPTRQRQDGLKKLYESAMKTADNPREVEVVCYIDNDDNSYEDYNPPRLKKIGGERIVLSEMWNACWSAASGEYFGHMGDDIIFRSEHWDTFIKEAIDVRPKKVCFVWGNDHQADSQRNKFGTHGFIHKNWTDIIGRFVPPYFVSDYNDTWLNDISAALHVQTYLHQVETEHMHYSLGKAEIDDNTRDRLERHAAHNPERIYADMKPERDAEIEKLREYINAP